MGEKLTWNDLIVVCGPYARLHRAKRGASVAASLAALLRHSTPLALTLPLVGWLFWAAAVFFVWNSEADLFPSLNNCIEWVLSFYHLIEFD